MKKLMIAAAIVCAAAFAQAAAIQWQITGITDAPGSMSGGVAGQNYTAYIFLTDGAEMNATTTLDAVLAAFTGGAYPDETLPTTYASVNPDSSTAVLDLDNLVVTGAKPETPVTLTAMAVIFDSWNSDPTYTETPVWSQYQTLTKTFEFTEDAMLPGSSVAENAWVTPEPTTGLLMLVGLAGLALKRKRA